MPDATDRLQLENTWLDDGRLFALWRPHSRALLQRTRIRLHRELRGKLYRSCAHLKGHGGVKGALRYIARRQPNYRYVACFGGGCGAGFQGGGLILRVEFFRYLPGGGIGRS